ncbi:hypothetical protein DFH07DRAFT_763491 [Mycena maculata]|uniref:Uncharacterized protein n=1 Tax=Mycena maculata TaxID=230809 RepID=A0AAD7P1S1_9AGAR|nr:hypothetical protein DFH07DRAFT_763491 [Mycena maculata]
MSDSVPMPIHLTKLNSQIHFLFVPKISFTVHKFTKTSGLIWDVKLETIQLSTSSKSDNCPNDVPDHSNGHREEYARPVSASGVEDLVAEPDAPEGTDAWATWGRRIGSGGLQGRRRQRPPKCKGKERKGRLRGRTGSAWRGAVDIGVGVDGREGRGGGRGGGGGGCVKKGWVRDGKSAKGGTERIGNREHGFAGEAGHGDTDAISGSRIRSRGKRIDADDGVQVNE